MHGDHTLSGEHASGWDDDGADDLPGGGLRIDCDTCAVRGPGCGDCVVAVLLGMPPVLRRLEGELVDGRPLPADLDAEEGRALAVLAEAGIVPHLRLVPAVRGALRAG